MTNRIREIREDHKIKQAQLLAALPGWGQSRLATYEAGRIPSLEDCRRIVEALNSLGAECSLDEVFPPQPADQPADQPASSAA